MSRKIQIGIMGSMQDVSQKISIISMARDLGKQIADKNAVLLFGYEGDHDSLSIEAAREAEKLGASTVAFNWGKKNNINKEMNSILVETGQQRGGGREFPLILSCDAIICIGGGSGTLTEIAMAYQADIPVVVIENSGGWSQKLADKFLDDRRRQKIHSVRTVKGAVKKAINLAEKYAKL